MNHDVNPNKVKDLIPGDLFYIAYGGTHNTHTRMMFLTIATEEHFQQHLVTITVLFAEGFRDDWSPPKDYSVTIVR